VLEPAAVGENVMLITQLAFGTSGAVQLLVWLNAPLAKMLVNVSEGPPVLVMVTACGVLVVPTG
jgi:hypothetical protein